MAEPPTVVWPTWVPVLVYAVTVYEVMVLPSSLIDGTQDTVAWPWPDSRALGVSGGAGYPVAGWTATSS